MNKIKYFLPLFIIFFLLTLFIITLFTSERIPFRALTKTEKMMRPADVFWQQRAYPFDEIPYEKYFSAMEKKSEQIRNIDGSQVSWIPAGPDNIGGRITAVVADPVNPNIIIAAAAAGGIFKTTNGGQNWSPKTDLYPSLSTGALVMHPLNPQIIYCGTGEANSAIDNYPGFGVLRSTDQGDTWEVTGLTDALYIGAIDIHPLNPNLMYAAVLSHKKKDQNKGIYKSTNGGVNWLRVLFVTDSTSGIDVNIDPLDMNIIHAAMWERVRIPPFSKTGGLTSGMYRSTDAGNTWTLLGTTNGLPAPASTTGRITIDVAPSDPNILYALYATTVGNGLGGFYKSINRGLTWTSVPLSPVQNGGFSWYFGLVEVDPLEPSRVYIGDVDLWRSTTGGGNWVNMSNSYAVSYTQQHPDQHALWINPVLTSNMIIGNDGGIYKSSNGGTNWTKSYNLPITQFYAGNIDHKNPQVRLGGTQDNGTLRTTNAGISDWQMIFGADGFRCFVDSTNSLYVYACYQNGSILRSANGGSSFVSITAGLDLSRTYWNTPYMPDPAEQSHLYFGSYKVFRSTNRGTNWTAISPDLTRGPNVNWGKLTAISVETLPNSQRVIYTGSDDAKVSVSTNTGANWTDVTGILPNRFVTDVQADKRNPNIAYVTLSGFFVEDKSSHVYRTTNFGTNWTNISGNLLNVPVNSIQIDYNYDSVLYTGGDAGVYYTTNLGESWLPLGTDMPNSPVHDIIFHHQTRKLFAATHGRSMFEFNTLSVIGIKQISDITPEQFQLYQNYPNPFNPNTKIKFSIPKGKVVDTDVKLQVYNSIGQQVATIIDMQLKPGTYETDFNGSELSSGIYFYSLIVNGSVVDTRKMILLK